MSERQYEIYCFIVNYVKKHLYAPSVDEIRQEIGLKSKATVAHHLKVIEQLGYIKIKNDVSRAITLQGYKIVRSM